MNFILSATLVLAGLRATAPAPIPEHLRVPLEAAAHEAHLPAAVLASLVEHESRWNERVLGGMGGQCVGLTQICLHTVRACRSVRGRFDFESPACVHVREHLRDGAANLHVAGKRLAEWKSYCLKRTGRAEPRHVISGFGGWDAKLHLTCGQRRVSVTSAHRTSHLAWVDATPHEVRAIVDGTWRLRVANHKNRRKR